MILITLLATLCYLVPSTGNSWWRLYVNANLFNHLLTPLIAMSAYFLVEAKYSFKYKYVLASIIPMLIYGTMYLIRALPHYDPSKKADLYYDIYGFTRFGVFATFGILILFILLAGLIATGLLFARKDKNKEWIYCLLLLFLQTKRPLVEAIFSN